MSIEAIGWALEVPVTGNTKVVLLGLANHAHPDGTESYPAFDTLARYAHCDRSTVKRQIKLLREAGWIADDGFGPRGQRKFRLSLHVKPNVRGGQNAPPPSTAEGGQNAPGPECTPGSPVTPRGGAQVTPEPSSKPSGPTVENARANGGLPEGFPDELRAHGRIAARVLPTLTEGTPNAKAVRYGSIANVIMAYPHKPLITGLYEYAAWLTGQPSSGRHRDVVSGWRNWIKRKPDLAGYEQLDAQGLPVSAGNGTAPVGSASRHRPNASDLLRQINGMEAA